MKRKVKIIILLIIACITIIGYFQCPMVAMLKVQWDRWNLEQWKNDVLIMWDKVDYATEMAQKREANKEDKVFCSNEVIKLLDGVYLVGCYGVTNYCTFLYLYSRESLVDYDAVDIDKIWKYNIECVDETGKNNCFTSYIKSPSPMYGDDCIKLFIIPSPVFIEDNELTLTIHSTNIPSRSSVKKIDVKVEYLLEEEGNV